MKGQGKRKSAAAEPAAPSVPAAPSEPAAAVSAKPKREPRKPPDPADVEDWLTGSDVTALGVTPRALSRWSEAGVVQRCKDSAGQWRFNPQDVEQQRSRVNTNAGARDEVLESFRALLNLTVTHLERSWSQVHEPGQLLLALLAKENSRLAGRCEKLEDRHLQFLDLFEKLITQQHQRELEARMVDQREARKDKALGKLTDAAPAFLQQVAAGMGATALVKSITDEQLMVLTEAEFLSGEQKALLKAEVARRSKAKAKASEAEKKTAPNGATTEDKTQ